MRSTFYLAVLGFFVAVFPACDVVEPEARGPGFPAVPDSVEQAYYEDAQQLAVRRMASADNASVEIPEAQIQPFHHALLSVYTARDIAARDSILGIHARSRYHLREVIVGVSEDAGWAEAWANGHALTGYPPIDDLVSAYDLSVHQWVDGITFATLRSTNALNTVALSEKFEGIAGVRYADPNSVVGGGSDIEAKRLDDGVKLMYTRGWGDCPSGCAHETTWTFWVGAGGAVSFEGRSSD